MSVATLMLLPSTDTIAPMSVSLEFLSTTIPISC